MAVYLMNTNQIVIMIESCNALPCCFYGVFILSTCCPSVILGNLSVQYNIKNHVFNQRMAYNSKAVATPLPPSHPCPLLPWLRPWREGNSCHIQCSSPQRLPAGSFVSVLGCCRSSSLHFHLRSIALFLYFPQCVTSAQHRRRCCAVRVLKRRAELRAPRRPSIFIISASLRPPTCKSPRSPPERI